MACPRLGLLCLNWLLTSVRAAWSPVVDQGRPPGRSVHVAAWDAIGRQIWIHGGSQSEFLDDLWTYNVDNKTWERKWPPAPAPSKRGDHVAVWDPCEPALWIHGGFDGRSFFKDLWKYSGNSWTEVTVDGPQERSDHVAVWDTANGALWVHGGDNGVTLMQDIWKYDSLHKGTWVLVQDVTPPSAMARHAGVWDDRNLALWIHGGDDGSSFCYSEAKRDGFTLRFGAFLRHVVTWCS